MRSPNQFKTEFQTPPQIKAQIKRNRAKIAAILTGKSPLRLLILGPCSIHNFDEAIEYAHLLRSLSTEVRSHFLLAMRVYIDKPRSSVGWRGLLNDPSLDNRNDLIEGLELSRKLMLEVTKLGVPIAQEVISPFCSPYLQDLISWGCIGARTSSSPTHRELAASIPAPCGIKNPLSGNILEAINSVAATQTPHQHWGLADGGDIVPMQSVNPHTHLVLRGGEGARANTTIDFDRTQLELLWRDLSPYFVVDCAHGNSNKTTKQQIHAFRTYSPLLMRESPIRGLMLESYLQQGNQALSSSLLPGLSVTDPCLGWETTSRLIREAVIYKMKHTA